METEPEDFSKIEDKFKLSLNQIQKRIVDLEVAISELSSKTTDTKMPNDLAQRVEDLEDMSMVESMGINELKKMMEQPQGTGQTNDGLSGLEQRIANLENQINSMPQGTDQGE